MMKTTIKLTSSEIKAHLKYWVMGDKESSISETKIDPATEKEKMTENEAIQRAFDPDIYIRFENINQQGYD